MFGNKFLINQIHIQGGEDINIYLGEPREWQEINLKINRNTLKTIGYI